MPDSCEICCETLNKSTRKCITCSYCHKDTCITCVKKFLLDLFGDPKCMHCNVGWSNNFMRSTFPSSWISKDYKIHREKVLFDMEKARMHETQEYLPLVAEKSENKNKLLRMNDKITDLHQQLVHLHCSKRRLEVRSSRIEQLLTNGINHNNEDAQEIEKRKFVMPCPLGDCRGFLSTLWKCGVCHTNICKDCHHDKLDPKYLQLLQTVNDDDMQTDNVIDANTATHVCDKDIKASVSLMKQDSKQCPSCNSMIFKITGCDQMWCTQCNCAFSWKTGLVQTGAVHNPHYFDWLVQNGNNQNLSNIGNLNNNNCGQRFLDNLRLSPNNTYRERIRLLQHILQVDIPKNFTTNNQDENRRFRIEYMMGEMSKEKFQNLIHKREKNRSKKKQLSDIMNMFVDVMEEILRHFYQENDTKRLYNEEMEKIRVYTIKCSIDISKQYQSQSVWFIDNEFKNSVNQKINDEIIKEFMFYSVLAKTTQNILHI